MFDVTKLVRPPNTLNRFTIVHNNLVYDVAYSTNYLQWFDVYKILYRSDGRRTQSEMDRSPPFDWFSFVYVSIE